MERPDAGTAREQRRPGPLYAVLHLRRFGRRVSAVVSGPFEQEREALETGTRLTGSAARGDRVELLTDAGSWLAAERAERARRTEELIRRLLERLRKWPADFDPHAPTARRPPGALFALAAMQSPRAARGLAEALAGRLGAGRRPTTALVGQVLLDVPHDRAAHLHADRWPAHWFPGRDRGPRRPRTSRPADARAACAVLARPEGEAVRLDSLTRHASRRDQPPDRARQSRTRHRDPAGPLSAKTDATPPAPAGPGRVIALSNDAAHDPRRPFWIVGRAADGPEDAHRPWHGTAQTLWAGDPPDDSATRIPHPALGQLAGHDARLRESSAPVTPLAVSWDRGKAGDNAGVVWFSDGSTLPLASYLALLHHAGARAGGAPPRGTVTWTAAPRWPLLQAELDGRRIAALVRLKRSARRDAEARTATAAIDEWNAHRSRRPA